jgi:endoglucanase
MKDGRIAFSALTLVAILQNLTVSGCTGAKTSAKDAASGTGGGSQVAQGGAEAKAGAGPLDSSGSGGAVAVGLGGSAAEGLGGSGPSGGAGSSAGEVGGSGASGSAQGGGSAVAPFLFGVPPAAAAHFQRGINLGNRLEAPNEGDWGGVIASADFPFIARRGFDHVRIPIRFSGHALATAPYTIEPAFFQRIDTVLDQAAAANLAVVIDMHAYDELALNVTMHKDRFVSLWGQVAARYQQRPDTVAFELLNEPNGQLDSTWNDLLPPVIQTIRASNPHRLLIVDSVYWADPTRLAVLSLPNDANLMASIHFYEPKLFTFQGMAWMGPPYLTTGVAFPGPPNTPIVPVQAAKDSAWSNQWFIDYNSKPAATNPSGPATIAAQLALILAYRQAQGRAVYNGEWGPQGGGALDSRVRLVTLVRRECEKAGIGWAIWEDPVNMKLFDSQAGTWLTGIVDALLPP